MCRSDTCSTRIGVGCPASAPAPSKRRSVNALRSISRAVGQRRRPRPRRRAASGDAAHGVQPTDDAMRHVGTVGGMPELKDRLHADLNTAMKARDELTTATLRMALTAVTTEEVAGKQRPRADRRRGAAGARPARPRSAARRPRRSTAPAATELAERERAEGEVLDALPAGPARRRRAGRAGRRRDRRGRRHRAARRWARS